ncbi:uncharacterized protein LOC112243695 isoform X1 [Oncorhynchus tshawytscha]|uniref:uncharacterized protein LOC112243695 isoform X1 n=1 Tax=Oncorhynchus tshawytscha TaxID=74940 RepID=UPI001C3D60F6|nr:uncharacterized protein LOC112243695 isoform X1 [Oncorhynchus tshawytscha]XP_042168566.1 uncharacterized protein LOC112243695 isoform X1 [Oncorhynchus tshawytscha]XP_042168567.1 uncharacterized protein LOC112243695 isoform X1 [Oncorhynchus tshawytscha]XP_042168568.1 uncharacterized protein LOC112243695 isoform X1 [Oncorhynchus tshawytscha]XP_042168569.1 uncharacterized protein LOC112243695 isoform X1 [Oncorhynchus tshawytscha]
MDRNDERIKRALRRRPYVLKPVRVNTPDSMLWPTGKVHRRPKPSNSVQTPQIHKRPPIIVSYGQDQTSGDGWSINPEPLSQSGRVTRLIERKYDDVISSSSSDDFSIYSFTDCESECDDEDHERRTPKLKVENGKVTKLDVRDMDEDDLSLHSFDESDFLSPGKVSGPVSVKNGLSPLVTSAHRTLAEALWALPSAVGSPYPVNVPRPRTPLNLVIIAPPRTENFPYRHSPRLAPITNLSETGRKLLQEMAGVAPQEGKVNKKKKSKAKKELKQEKASKTQQMGNVGESKEEDKKEEKKSLKKRFLEWLLPKLRCSKK